MPTTSPSAPTAGDDGVDEEAETQFELVAWWTDLFVVPVVAVCIETAEDAARIAPANPDFITVRLPGADSAKAGRRMGRRNPRRDRRGRQRRSGARA